ncbi:MAG: DUF2141 domain-containing protein [Pseudomonadota bacterium]
MRRAAAALMCAALVTMAAPAAAGEVVITITDLRSDKGVVRACMTTQEKIFPKCRKDPASHRTVVPAGESVTIRFTDVEPGDYAVALLHDENNDGKANRALGMMPKEGYGFSRDAKVRMGPPKFGDAVFEHVGEDQELTIKMRYFL